MVGMDIVSGGASVNAASEYPWASLPRGVVQDVSSALEVLHALGRPVHRHNVMDVKREGRAGAMLVDFYWAGEDGRVRYPAWLNMRGGIAWAEGFEPEGPIRVQHDREMLSYL